METKSCLSLLLLLLLGLSQATPLVEEEYDFEMEGDDLSISSIILSRNNASDEFLLEGDMKAPKTRNAMTCWSNGCRWQKDSQGKVTIPYTVSHVFSSGEKQKIERALKSFHSRTCIRFVPYQNQRDYISIVNRNGCWSELGRTGGRQELSLARDGCVYHGVIQHETLHALGFQHEQTRSDRDKYVRINWDYIQPATAYNFYKQQTENLGTPYDYGSIMHYGRTAFTTTYGMETITPIPNANVRIGQRQGLSRLDIQRVNRLYC